MAEDSGRVEERRRGGCVAATGAEGPRGAKSSDRVEDRKRGREERSDEGGREVELVGTSYSFILKRPRKIASTVLLLHAPTASHAARLTNPLHSVSSCTEDPDGR